MTESTSTFTFETSEIPASTKAGRTPLPNPFVGNFPSDDKSLVVTLTGDDNTAQNRNRLIRQARQAAKAVERSARQDTTPGDGQTVMKFWTVPLVKRATATTEAEAPVETPAEKTPAKKVAASGK